MTLEDKIKKQKKECLDLFNKIQEERHLTSYFYKEKCGSQHTPKYVVKSLNRAFDHMENMEKFSREKGGEK
jgi:hypothetical protein